MATQKFNVPRGSLLQLPDNEARHWFDQKLKTSPSFAALYRAFLKEKYAFYFERGKVFVYTGLDSSGMLRPRVLGVLPSFIPATSADASHRAVGISIDHSGYALATSVDVGHRPFGVREFTLHQWDPKKKKLSSATLSAKDVADDAIDKLAKRLPEAALAKKGSSVSTADKERLKTYAEMAPGDQGMMIGAVVRQLLGDKYSKSLFPPEYARAISMQTPTMQKFAFAARARFENALVDVTLSTSSSTSSNICTSTSSSTFDLVALEA
ncbi:hypothetical protein [Nocardioides sp. LHG3406-4]|uniref:hypothetical protein n=1 Tax=Nocardioides sp. LHG3406-4 TaxID=2804575 RepID=UPI003CE6A806